VRIQALAFFLPTGRVLSNVSSVSQPMQESENSHKPTDAAGCRFQATHWSVILSAGNPASPNHHHAQEQFCKAYREPVYWYVRGRGNSPEDAEDLTQQFFLRFLKDNALARVSQEGGKFRGFLTTCLKNFLNNEYQHKKAQKCGGGKPHLAYDEAMESRYQQGLSTGATPDEYFDRKWALTALEQARQRLREEYRRDGKEQLYEMLKRALPGAQEELCYAEAAKALGKSEDALRMEVSRLRKRFRVLLRWEVATPDTKPEKIDEELRYLSSIVNHW